MEKRDYATRAHGHAQGYNGCRRKLIELRGLDYYPLSKTRKHYVREHIRDNEWGLRDHRRGYNFWLAAFWDDNYNSYRGTLLKPQALACGMITRRKVHFALLSADPDALAMATAC